MRRLHPLPPPLHPASFIHSFIPLCSNLAISPPRRPRSFAHRSIFTRASVSVTRSKCGAAVKACRNLLSLPKTPAADKIRSAAAASTCGLLQSARRLSRTPRCRPVFASVRVACGRQDALPSVLRCPRSRLRRAAAAPPPSAGMEVLFKADVFIGINDAQKEKQTTNVHSAK